MHLLVISARIDPEFEEMQLGVVYYRAEQKYRVHPAVGPSARAIQIFQGSIVEHQL